VSGPDKARVMLRYSDARARYARENRWSGAVSRHEERSSRRQQRRGRAAFGSAAAFRKCAGVTASGSSSASERLLRSSMLRDVRVVADEARVMAYIARQAATALRDG